VSRKAQHAEEHPDERWVISYADLVTLLLGFFILLYATTDQNLAKMNSLARGLSSAFNVPVKEGAGGESLFDGGTGIIPERNDRSDIPFDLEAIRRTIQKESEASGMEGKIAVEKGQDRIILRLADNLVFPSASADIRPEALPILEVVAKALARNNNEVSIEGHTDNIPLATDRYPSNWELSSARATAVLRVLTETYGVDTKRVFSAGYGENRPVASNLTPEGRAVNRRADIVILYPAARLEGALTTTKPATDNPAPKASPTQGGAH
jgi:chemotaxis protein MotB